MAKKIHVRPGKNQSKMGFAVGLVFCAIGLFVVIPTFGIFGIFWTAVAAVITFTNYKNGFTSEGVDSHVIEIDEDGAETVEERLKTLQDLYDQRLITREEYEEKRQEILKDL